MLASTRRTFARISSAVAVQENGLALAFQWLMYSRICLMSALTLLKVPRRIEIEPDDVGDLLGERRVLAHLEGAYPVRLQSSLAPQFRHIVMRYRHILGPFDESSHLPARPMRQPGIGRRAHPGGRQNPGPYPCGHLLTRRRVGSIKKSGDSFPVVAMQPVIHRGA